MTKKPHADTKLAKYIDRRILELKATKNQAQIAAEAGYPNPNMITMIKQGTSKVALDRVPALAKALDCDPAWLMRLALEQAIGSTAAMAVTDVFGDRVSANERAWLVEIRNASGETDPRLTTRGRSTLRSIFGK